MIKNKRELALTKEQEMIVSELLKQASRIELSVSQKGLRQSEKICACTDSSALTRVDRHWHSHALCRRVSYEPQPRVS